MFDPWAEAEEVHEEYGIDLVSKLDETKMYNAIIVAVAHDEFKSFDFAKYKNQGAIIYDVKGFVDRDLVDARL